MPQIQETYKVPPGYKQWHVALAPNRLASIMTDKPDFSVAPEICKLTFVFPSKVATHKCGEHKYTVGWCEWEGWK